MVSRQFVDAALYSRPRPNARLLKCSMVNQLMLKVVNSSIFWRVETGCKDSSQPSHTLKDALASLKEAAHLIDF